MTILVANLLSYLLCLIELKFKLVEEDDKTFFYKLYKEIANKILAYYSSQFSKILNVKKSTTQATIVATFSVLSMLLCSKGNIEA